MTGKHSDKEYRAAAAFFKALAHPLRVKIVCGLLEEPATQTRIARFLGVPSSSVAQQVAVLRRAGIVVGDRDANEVVLRVADERVEEVFAAVCHARDAMPTFSWSDLSPTG